MEYIFSKMLKLQDSSSLKEAKFLTGSKYLLGVKPEMCHLSSGNVGEGFGWGWVQSPYMSGAGKCQRYVCFITILKQKGLIWELR